MAPAVWVANGTRCGTVSALAGKTYRLRVLAQHGPITLVFSAHDEAHAEGLTFGAARMIAVTQRRKGMSMGARIWRRFESNDTHVFELSTILDTESFGFRELTPLISEKRD